MDRVEYGRNVEQAYQLRRNINVESDAFDESGARLLFDPSGRKVAHCDTGAECAEL